MDINNSSIKSLLEHLTSKVSSRSCLQVHLHSKVSQKNSCPLPDFRDALLKFMLSYTHFPIKLTRKLLLKNMLIACLSLQFALAICKKTHCADWAKAEAYGELFSAHLHEDLFCFVPGPCSQPMLALLFLVKMKMASMLTTAKVQFILSTV